MIRSFHVINRSYIDDICHQLFTKAYIWKFKSS